MQEYSSQSSLACRAGSAAVVLDLGVHADIDIGEHLEGDADEEGVSAAEDIDEEERREEAEEELGERVHAGKEEVVC